MGYELSLRGTRRGAPREVRNPFTGRMVTHVPLEMSEAELRAVRDVLARRGAVLDARGSGFLELRNARFAFTSLDAEGDLVKVNGERTVCCELLLEIATAGELAIVPDDGPVIVTTPDALARAKDLEEELDANGECMLVTSVTELAAAFAAIDEAALASTRQVALED